MKYADEQIVRPQVERGCDYGHGRRSVLVRNGHKEILHVAGQKHWGGIGCDRNYSPAEIVAWDPDAGGVLARQETLHEGRMTPTAWIALAPRIFEHLGKTFPVELIDLKRTLLLDVPGTVEPAPRTPRKPPVPKPRVEADRLYRLLMDDAYGKLHLVVYKVLAQSKGMVTFDRLKDGQCVGRPSTLLVDRLERSDIYITVAAAKAAYVATFVRQLDEAIARRQDAASRVARCRENLADARRLVAECNEEE